MPRKKKSKKKTIKHIAVLKFGDFIARRNLNEETMPYIIEIPLSTRLLPAEVLRSPLATAQIRRMRFRFTRTYKRSNKVFHVYRYEDLI